MEAEKPALYEDILRRLNEELLIAGYSGKTLKMYGLYTRRFLEETGKPPEVVDRGDIVAFLARKKQAQNVSNATLALAHSALKFFFHTFLKRKIVEDIKVPKKAKKLKPSIPTFRYFLIRPYTCSSKENKPILPPN